MTVFSDASQPDTQTRNKRDQLSDQIADPDGREALARVCEQTPSEAYGVAVHRLLAWTDGVFGPRNQKRNAFGVHYSIAVAYGFLVLFLGWFLFDIGTIAGTDLLPTGFPFWRRAIAVSALLLWFLYSSKFDRIYGALERSIFSKVERYARLSPQSPNDDTTVIAPSKSVRVATHSAIRLVSCLVPVFLWCVFFAALGATIAPDFRIIAAIFYLIVLGIIMFGTQRADYAVTAIGIWPLLHIIEPSFIDVAFLFVCLLPLSNALADFVSLYLARYSLERLRGTGFPTRLIFAKVIADIIVALVCLTGMLFSIIWVLIQFAARYPDALIFDWRAYRDAILAGDYSQIHMVVLLGITTLVPTAVHIAIGLRAFFKQRGRLRANCAESLRALGDQTSVAPDISRDIADQIIQGDKRGTVWATAFMGCLCVAVWLGFLWLIAP